MRALGAKPASEADQPHATGTVNDRRAIDNEHLERITLGDRRLECEVLQIFVRQSAMMLQRICKGEPGPLGIAAHTLVGSARGIGAWRVAEAAEALEHASRESRYAEIDEAIAELKAASLEATAAIGARLGDPSH